MFGVIILITLIAFFLPKNNGNINELKTHNNKETGNQLFDQIVSKVLPEKGYESKIVLGDSMLKLVENGVIDKAKLLSLYQEDKVPEVIKKAVSQPLNEQILLTRESANYYVNLLWGLGLANYMSSNEKSSINGDSLFNYASTAGWTIGKEENGGSYFNKFKIVPLTSEQEALVTKIAQNTYRPCCNNPTFYQDCNHGSALLGLLQLGASQGLSEEELYKEALAFNSFWFPQNYIQTAIYFKVVKNIDWEDVDPKTVMGKDFSSISGWNENVNREVSKLNIIPQKKGGANCGV